jgi:HlyD family secretion protein
MLTGRMVCWGFLVLLGVIASGCSGGKSTQWQGYIEGEMVYVATALPGELERLLVRRGAQVKAGELLFILDSQAEQASRREANERLAQARFRLENLKKGRRAVEMEVLQARLDQAQTSLKLSETELKRWNDLYAKGVASASEIDRIRSTYERDQRLVTQYRAEFETGRLGAREDEIKAGEAEVSAAEAALARADWNLAQKQKKAPAESLVFDTLFNEGEWVPTGSPVVALLPPANLKVRFFVPEPMVSALKMGQQVWVQVDGRSQAISARVNYISPQAEFTPPVMYNRENRSKLVVMVEAGFEPKDAASLHPGQPVDVQAPSP